MSFLLIFSKTKGTKGYKSDFEAIKTSDNTRFQAASRVHQAHLLARKAK